MSRQFSTATVADPSRLSYWRQVVSEAFIPYEVAVPRHRAEGFRGTVTAQQIGAMQVATVDADAHTVFRTPSLVRRSPQDDFLVNLAVRGSVTVTQDERDAFLRPGEFTLYDSARPCRITGVERFRLVSLKIPRALFTAHCPSPRDATATVVRGDHGVGALFPPYLHSLTRHAAELAPDVVQQVGINVLELLGAALPKPSASGAALPRSAQWLRARQFIAEHIADPQLSPAGVADALGVSVRYLQVLFRAEGTSPSRSIMEQRLERAARLLTDPRHAGRTITDIAFGLGFKDTSHFTRAFKNHCGTGPRAYRAGHSSLGPV
ncbi:helix-turn-helix domain-containing protein [Streptomyces sp. ID05-04B]|uniref:AraC-like ligand-binding domain-containing protein n=1 Tax=Streptomyces sp. ID05-04B TaxID=3028661 RepID=UPI0029C1DE14|nr:helix-turn-helix domain-containing protein [Streptomyces sp. ID05-04B]MDX5568875.1 helix-turn-helix domain-containing protein [Streptomyces sp. ID05-04B]